MSSGPYFAKKKGILIVLGCHINNSRDTESVIPYKKKPKLYSLGFPQNQLDWSDSILGG
jgi:hypothetical protein